MGKRRKPSAPAPAAKDDTRRNKILEYVASAGLLIVVIALAAPFLQFGSAEFLSRFKWVYTAGALMYLGARCVPTGGPGEPLRLRRARRMQFWAGVAFGIGAFFWFYQEDRLGGMAGAGAIIRQTVVFSMVGALLQLVSAWMISWQLSKMQQREADDQMKGKGN